ncbi:related to peptidylarginine deiminase and related enzymes [Cephalotrichum gorgonifer]|uniref:Related to peptidylarginine deiminase and related enzymes n=1 Tax=Cephalotrichum gorgonifer TaxID=2041049 RepID=A0AAE8SYX7_9PEZI|nr:related to peptidylarginine deiminase and related enzymes [Cephalotrichum gorgonifer]
MAETSLSRRGEWQPQEATIMGWPGLEGSLKLDPERLASVTKEVSFLAQAIAHFQPVVLVVGNARVDEAEKYFSTVETPFPIRLHRIDGNDLGFQMRDIAPTFVAKQDSGPVGVDYNFNGWGERDSTPTATKFAQTFLGDRGTECIKTSIVAEGGALETDGEGTLLVTESSIINDNRNPGKTREDIEDELKRTLGLEKIIWIPGRKDTDSTDRHISALARFARPGVVVLSKANEEKESDWTVTYQEALEILSSVTDAKGRPFEIIEVEEPDPTFFDSSKDGDRPVRSYVNYTLVNGGIIVPQFGDPAHDAAAIRTFQMLFGDERRIFPILIEELPKLGGGIHSSTQELPRYP